HVSVLEADWLTRRAMAEKGKLIIGFDTNCVPDLNALLDDARQDHFDFVAIPLVHPRFKRDALGVSSKREDPLTRSDFLLDSRQWSSLIVGKISEWLDMDSPCEESAWASELAFKQEMAWATHLALAAVVAPAPKPGRCANYARCINQVAQELTYLAVWLRIPLVHPEAMDPALNGTMDPPLSGGEGGATSINEIDVGTTNLTLNAAGGGEGANVSSERSGEGGGQQASTGGGGQGKVVVEDPWETWNAMRVMCEHKSCLSVVLEITADLPAQSVLERWVGEPVKAVIVPTSVFLTNKKGFPTLSRRHQDFVTAMIKQKVQFVIKGRAHHASGYLPYLQYLEHLRTRMPAPKEHENFEAPYLDYLQAPLQPLMDNLESQTYEAFEKDPVKYKQYESAIVKALELEQAKEAKDTTILMVVGAGRGPLVQAALNAGETAGRALKVYAVEKNANAVITLRNRAVMDKWTNVTIVAKDMRDWAPEEKADILVSELLGSWGDNELSPECLDGAQRFLKDGGISIPQEYTSYVAPMSSHKLWREVSNFEELKRLETAYVVKLHNFVQLAEEKPCFTFHHPNKEGVGSETHNKRHIEIDFDVEQASTLHGFAGFFDSRLFADIHISIVPKTFSEGMFSWFPLYIPLRTPVVLKPGDKVSAHFWRCTSSTKVWYEWALTSPTPSPIHNPNGRSYWIGL
ncbi:unnamed protein product, partial [Scytosiphon promiscuus]